VIEIELTSRGKDVRWQLVRPSTYARRITARTPMRIDGPAAGTAAMRTRDDAGGQRVAGTLANCAMGVTPWGTYLTCEEHFNAYFNGLDQPTPTQKRYGIRARSAGYRWHEHDRRFDVASEPNEANSPTKPIVSAGSSKSIPGIRVANRSSTPHSAASNMRERC